MFYEFKVTALCNSRINKIEHAEFFIVTTLQILNFGILYDLENKSMGKIRTVTKKMLIDTKKKMFSMRSDDKNFVIELWIGRIEFIAIHSWTYEL